jgi:hypothetical protein
MKPRALLLTAIFLSACNGSSDNGDGAIDGVSSDGSMPGDASMGGDGSSDGSSDDASMSVDVAGTTRRAMVVMVSGPGGGANIEGANFWDVADTDYVESGGTPYAGTCTVTRMGACELQQCVLQSGQNAQSAGTLTLSTDGGSMVTLTAQSMGPSYPSGTTQTSATWRDGDAVHVMASGSAEVPAFSGVVTCPSTTRLTAPASDVTVSRSTDLSVTFDPLTHGDARAEIRSPDQPFDRVVCIFPGASGSGTVPAALLGGLPAGATSIDFRSYAESTVVAGRWAVSLVAEVNAIGATSITLQ